MELIDIVKFLAGNGSAGVAGGLATAAGIFALWVNYRKVDMEASTSASRLQQEHNKFIMEQNQTLAQDLAALRKLQGETYDEMNVLRQRPQQCATCPYKDQK